MAQVSRMLTTAVWLPAQYESAHFSYLLPTCMPGAREFMQSLTCHKKFFSLLIWRSYCQHVASGIQGYNTSFNPTRRALDRADNEFELIGPKASFQGSALKLEDAPKLKLPEVMFRVTFHVHSIRPSYLFRPQINHIATNTLQQLFIKEQIISKCLGRGGGGCRGRRWNWWVPVHSKS